MKNILLLFTAFFIFGCKTPEPLQTVASVDLAKYTGKWYEIAAFPQPFEKGCSCVTAEYGVSGKKYIVVSNSCFKAADKKKTRAKGKAFIVKGSGYSKLKVQFLWPFKGKYWIIELADDYSYAVVGNPARSALWILARDKKMNEDIYNSILDKVSKKGFDITKLKKTDQSCVN
jgi:apolipoprotein D and lipocalin family protein